MAKALIDTKSQKGHFSYQKSYFTKMAPNINGISQKWRPTKNDITQKWHLKTYIIGFLKCYQNPANRTYPYN